MKGDEAREEQRKNGKEKKAKEKEPPKERSNVEKRLRLYFHTNLILTPRFDGALRRARIPEVPEGN